MNMVEQCVWSCGSEFQMWGPKQEKVHLFCWIFSIWNQVHRECCWFNGGVFWAGYFGFGSHLHVFKNDKTSHMTFQELSSTGGKRGLGVSALCVESAQPTVLLATQLSCSKVLLTTHFSCSERLLTTHFGHSQKLLTTQFSCSKKLLTTQFICKLPTTQFSCSKVLPTTQFNCSQKLLTTHFSCSKKLLTTQFSCSKKLLTTQFSCSEKQLTTHFSCSNNCWQHTSAALKSCWQHTSAALKNCWQQFICSKVLLTTQLTALKSCLQHSSSAQFNCPQVLLTKQFNFTRFSHANLQEVLLLSCHWDTVGPWLTVAWTSSSVVAWYQRQTWRWKAWRVVFQPGPPVSVPLG